MKHCRHYLDQILVKPISNDDEGQILKAFETAYSDLQNRPLSSKLAELFIKAVNRFARYLGSKGSYRDRIVWGKKALEIAEEIGDNVAVAELCASTIAWPLLQQGKYDQAKEYCERGLNAALQSNSFRWAGEAARSLSGIARDLKQPEEALLWAKRAFRYARQAIPRDKFVILLKRGAVMDLGYAALLNGKYREAEKRFQALLRLYISEDDDKERIANFHGGLAIVLLNQGRVDEAEKLLNKALEIASELQNNQVIIAETEFSLAIVADVRAHRLRLHAQHIFDQLGIERPSRSQQFVDLGRLNLV
jgi:tetratricopeptide (TPR) repeat protein